MNPYVAVFYSSIHNHTLSIYPFSKSEFLSFIISLDKLREVFIKRILVISALVIFSIFQISTTRATADWQIESVDDTIAGYDTSIAVDSLGYVHISSRDASGWLCYSTNSSGTWSTTKLDAIAHRQTSIAVDSNDKVHISYYIAAYGDLKYATNAFGGWSIQIVDGLNAGEMCSIALDSNDKVHISYRSGYDLEYATNATGSWTTEIVDNSVAIWYTSIAIDSNNKIHISYQDMENDDLKYATNASGTWATETVDSVGDTGIHTSIAVDSLDDIHISYHDNQSGSNENLMYAKKASDAWQFHVLDGGGCANSATSIAMDSYDKAHISYSGSDGETLMYVTDASGSWNIEVVDASIDGWLGGHNAIAVDSENRVHISYSAFATGLLYALKLEELSRINLNSPPNFSILSSAPTFSWTVDGGSNNVFAVDLALPPFVPFWSTYNNMHILIDQTSWTMPGSIWSVLPSGSRLYWRVRGVDLDVTPLNVVISDEIWSFYKQ